MDLPPTPDGLTNRWNLGLPWGNCYNPRCHVRNNLLKCSGCHVALYCSVAHQKAHRSVHKSTCNIVKSAREDLDREMEALDAQSIHILESDTPLRLEVPPGFWLRKPVRAYLQRRLNLMDAMLNFRTGDAVEIALTQSLRLLRLDHGDRLGFRSRVPGLYIRLGKDAEAWDFIKWYATTGSARDYAWDDTRAPFLNLRDQDIFEPFDGYADKLVDLDFLVCMTNIKIRLMLDLQMLERESQKPENAGAGYDRRMEWVREDAMCNTLYRRRDVVERQDGWAGLIADQRDQVEKMIKRVDARNKHYWPALWDPDRWAAAYPAPYTFGSPEEVNFVFRDTWYTWSECLVALDVVKQYIKK
ncbi:hypothetical protein F4821DRAFT_215783 [Hypoxylon rubiginosum]|uniref:Uncharacterized protein n=1 Tax=Hypoxylon rubiginosum TaxID=110542 RepID=A0ACC0CPS8_9PEZI|nr:hypothetical protein F4821DRAFT_215783 [Hypoxylon rubiginosum]